MIGIIIEIIFIFVQIFLFFYKNFAYVVWVLVFMGVESTINDVNPKHHQGVVKDYPREDCIKPPAQVQFLFKKVDTRLKDIPKEMYYSTIIQSIGFVVYTIVVIFVALLWGQYVGTIIGIIYLVISEGIVSFLQSRMENKSFRQRYKKLTGYNLKYYLISSDNSDPTEIGTCTIVSWYEKRKRKIATVKVVETGEVIKDVLIDGSLCEDENAVYTLYEICKLYYLKQMKRNKEKKNCNKKK